MRNIGNKNARSHGLSSHPIYKCWLAMKSRCTNPNHPAYKNYGGRGISVCKRWLTFINFWEDVHASWSPGLTLERKNVNKGYSPTNCCWVSVAEQQKNRTNSPPKKLREKLERLGLNYDAYKKRLASGWSEKEASSIPKGVKR